MKNKTKNNKSILIVSPYFNSVGGGERYIIQVAKIAQDMGYRVYFAWNNKEDIRVISDKLNIDIDISSIHLDTRVYDLYFGNNPLSMYLATRKYDSVFYLSDGSIPMLGGKNNILHIQVPFHGINGRSIKNKLKLQTINNIVVNSYFTKSIIDKEYGVSSTVVYPPVSIIKPEIKPHTKTPIHSSNTPPTPDHLNKSNVILSVGRFDKSINIKKQDILISAFRRLYEQDSTVKDWKLILIGGLSSGASEWINELRDMAHGLPIDIKPNASYVELQNTYMQAKIYWHGAGYGIDQNKNPELVEHFGITTVEAIMYGCIPLVVPKGGQLEIVKDEVFHWETIDDLVYKTQRAISKYESISKLVRSIDINRFTYTNFDNKIKHIIQ